MYEDISQIQTTKIIIQGNESEYMISTSDSVTSISVHQFVRVRLVLQVSGMPLVEGHMYMCAVPVIYNPS